jgi:outer membrane protein TolC
MMLHVRNIFLIYILLMPGAASAQSISLADVIHETFANNPDLPLSQLNSDFVKTEQQRIEGMLDPNVSARIGYSDEKVPTASPFASNKTLSGQISGNVSKPLQDGSSLTGSLNYSSTKFGYPSSTPPAFLPSINPIYQNQIDLTYRYPLLRGHGNPAYHEEMAASKQDEKAALWRVEILKEQLAEQATIAYFRLTADNLTVRLAKGTIQRAEKLLKYQKMREQFGLIERSDRLQAEALLATRRMDLSLAEATSRQGETNLNRLMLRPPNAPLDPGLNGGIFLTDAVEKRPLDKLLAEAEKTRPAFRVVEASLTASNARISAARNLHETKIDLVGQVGSRALNGSASKAVSQGFSLNDRFVSLSVELSDTITGNATKSAIKQAELSRQRALLERLQLRESVKSQLASAITTLNNSYQTATAATQRAMAEKNKFNAEVERYRSGRSDTVTVILFEGDLFTAELQAAVRQVLLRLATHQLALAQGTLLPALKSEKLAMAKP